jgi:pimeloyl-ACP methyl ester carboxylesterase
MLLYSVLILLCLISVNYYGHVILANKIKLPWYDDRDIIVVKNRRVHIKVKGNQEPLFLIHGSQMNLYDWRYNMDYLSEYFTVYAVDMIGSGFTDKPKESYSPQYYADFILDLLDYYKIEKASFIGSSWGGGHVFHFCLLNPDRVNRLVMSSPSGYGHQTTLLERFLKIKILGELVMLLGNNKTIEYELKTMFVNKAMVDKRLIHSVFKPIYMKGGMRAVLSSYRKEDFSFVNKNLEKIKAPVLIVWGHQDQVHSFEKMEKMKNRLEKASLAVIENSGHLPHEEKAAVFNEIALSFLKES